VAGDDILDPGWTNYRKTCLYATRDVTRLLIAGQNQLTVLLGNGMYNVTGGRYVKFKGSFGQPKLILQLRIELADGSVQWVCSDESWQTAPGPITFSCIYGGEDYDARLEEIKNWTRALVVDGPGGILRSQSQPASRVMRRYQPAKVLEPRPDVKIYDFGQNISGMAQITTSAPAGATVKLLTGELLDDQGLVTQKNTGSPVSYSYTCRGGGPETWSPRFTYTGFRYVQAQGAPLQHIESQFVHAAARRVGNFECSSELLNRIHILINNAILSNLQSVLTDCPHREKLGWLEQSHLMGDAILCNYDVPLLYAKISRDMREAQHTNGMVPTIAPQYTEFAKPHDVFNDSPEWGSAAVINPWLIYRRFGDMEILRENFGVMKAYVEYLHGRDKDGIIEFGLGDWYDIGPGAPGFSKLTALGLSGTAIYYQDVKILRHTCDVLGLKQDASRYADLADRILASFNAKFFDASTNRYDRNSQTASAMPLAIGMVPEANRAGVLSNLVDDIRAHENHITAGDIGFHYVVRALGEGGRSDVMFDLLNRSDPPSYGSQLARGATTLTEAWDANPRSSQNHLMLGHAEIWFYEYLAGLRVDMTCPPGRQLSIMPAMISGIDWTKASYESCLGLIDIDWERQEKSGKLGVTIPPNATARVVLPASDVSRAREGGRPLPDCPDIHLIHNESAPGKLACQVDAGRYLFEFAMTG
jgi:hypothetical protein